MTIKDSIQAAHPDAKTATYDFKEIYIADFTERTNSSRSVEVTGHNQTCPISGNPMDSAVFHNPSEMKVEYIGYDDDNYYNQKGDNIRHCEASMFPSGEAPVNWVVMLELKDCKPRNIKKHKFKARRQIFNVVKDLRERGILTSEKILGIVSVPRRHTDFNALIAGDIIQQTRYKRYTGITYFGTNEVLLIDTNTCRPVV